MSATREELLAARQKAIDESGWGLDFKLFQPRNLAFWTYALLVATGTLIVIQSYVVPGLKAFDQVLVLATLLFGLYTVPFWLFLQHEDRFGSVPGKLAAAAFVFGGTASVGAMALYANEAVRSLWAKGVSQSFAFDWSAALTAPFIEEVSKASGLILLILLAPRLIRTPFDGLILGAFLGLGFQVVEDVGYALSTAGSSFGADQLHTSQSTITVRVVLGIASHWAYSAIVGAGLIYLIGRRPQFEPRRLVGVGLILLAFVYHGLWDAQSALTNGRGLLAPILLIGLVFLILFTVYLVHRATVQPERDWMKELMAPETVDGVITDQELAALSGSRKDRKSYIKSTNNRADRKRARQLIVAAGDLAHQLARARGENTPEVEFARSEISRLRA
jgi:RsiW-degrading membrane proteinase PrsW (M82 family)